MGCRLRNQDLLVGELIEHRKPGRAVSAWARLFARRGHSQSEGDFRPIVFRRRHSRANELSSGKAYSAATDYGNAEEAFVTTLKAEPGFSGARRELGKAYLGQHWETEAQRELKLAIRNDANDGDAYYYLGATLVQSEKYNEGLPYLRAANNLVPGSWATYFYMGKAELSSKAQHSQ